MEYQLATVKSDRFMIMKQFQAMAEFWKRKDGTLTVNYTNEYQALSVEEKIVCQMYIQRQFEEVSSCD